LVNFSATQQQGLAILGTADLPLDIPTTDPLQVIAYALWPTVLSWVVTHETSHSAAAAA